MYLRRNLHIFVQITVSCPVKNHHVHYVLCKIFSLVWFAEGGSINLKQVPIISLMPVRSLVSCMKYLNVVFQFSIVHAW